MGFIIAICVILFLGCAFEAVLLLKDRGIVAEYVYKAKEMIATDGWRCTIKRVFEIILGKTAGVRHLPTGKMEKEDGTLEIAVYPTGGMGDYIISSKILDELMMYAPCRVTVFCEKPFFGNAIYGKRPDVVVKEYAGFEIERNKYDLALMVEHFIHVLNMDDSRVEQIAPELYRRMNYIRENWNELYIRIPEQCFRERIRFERCRVLGLDRWTELRMGQAFEIADKRTGISLDMAEKEKFRQLDLIPGQYITLNRGADSMRANQEQLKVWPVEHYAELIQKIKETFAGLQIVQLGGKESEPLPGVDTAILGESFELTKWIIKKSRCHIDCEGGLVHLAVQMSTPAVVVFGPTPLHMYGYEQNFNLVDEQCNNCMGTHEDWAYRCYRGLEPKHRCMANVTPERVLDACRQVVEQTARTRKRLKKQEACNAVMAGKVALINELDVAAYGIDPDNSEIVVFSNRPDGRDEKVNCYKKQMEYRYSMPENLAYDSDAFDTVILGAYEDREEALAEAVRIVRTGGTVIVEGNRYEAILE